MAMERLVRPFQLPRVTPPTRYVDAGVQQSPMDNIVFIVGAKGSVATGSASYSATAGYYCDSRNREYGKSPSRGVHKKRIKNPEDESQYVDIDVIDWVQLRGPNGQIWRMTFAKNPEVERGPDDPSVTAK
jgi:hypothetical protein